MPGIKREMSLSSEASESRGGSENRSESIVAQKRIKSNKSTAKAPTTPPRTTDPNQNDTNGSSKKTGAGGGASGSPKTRIPAEARRKIAQAIINKGASTVDLEQLVNTTGLTRQQVRSQLIDNRQNVRKQLLDLASSLQ